MSANLLARAVLGPGEDSPFSDAALLRAMLRFEAALAQAQAQLRIIPAPAAQAIVACTERVELDARALARDAREAGSLAIPLVRVLTAEVRAVDESAAAYVHFGATSQDVLDTALVLCTREATGQLQRALSAAARHAASRARANASVPALARTLLQPAGVTCMGLRFAHWSHALATDRQRLMATASTALSVSLGGATGNLAAWGESGPLLRAQMARALALHDPGVTWHTLRAPWLALACDAALAGATLGKIAHDVALCAMGEIGELREPEGAGRGGSTAMPHKRNPVLSMRVIAAVQPVPGILAGLLGGMRQEQERALGNWQAELGQIPELFTHLCAAGEALELLLAGLQVDPQRCRANLQSLQGTVFSEPLAALLMPALGRTDAQSLVAALSGQALEQHVYLRDLAASDQRLQSVPPSDLDAVFDLDRAAAASARLVEPLLQQAEALLQPAAHQ